MTTPPGWYPDPQPDPSAAPGDARRRERWWDGAAWSEQTRVRGAARSPFVAGIVGAVVLAASLGVGGLLVFAVPPATTHDVATAPPDPGGDGPSEPGGPDADIPALGVDLPVLHGWHHASGGPMVSTGTYACPGTGTGEDADRGCLRGAASIVVADAYGDAGASPEKVAKADIRRNAETSYDKGTYGGITGHTVLESGKTTVAGQEAYRVRWKIVNRVKPDAYVESVAFPHPDGSGQMLLLRAGFDIHQGAPPLRDMDRLARGVREVPPGHEGRRGDGSGDDGSGGDGSPPGATAPPGQGV